MNINGSFTIITGAYSGVSFSNNNEQAVNLVNTCLDADINRINSDITLENCYTQAGASCKNITNVNGDITLKGGEIDCNVSSVNGRSECINVKLKNVLTTNGKINLSDDSTAGNIKSTSGAIRMSASKAASLKATSGDITLNKSCVAGNVTLIAGNLSMENSTIGGALETTSSNVHIGAESKIKTIKLVGNNSFNGNAFSGSVTIGGGKNTVIDSYMRVGRCQGEIIINGVRYGSGNPTHNLATGQNTAHAQKKVITLGKDTVVENLELDGATCTLILKEGARFDGDHSMPGLTIQKA